MLAELLLHHQHCQVPFAVHGSGVQCSGWRVWQEGLCGGGLVRLLRKGGIVVGMNAERRDPVEKEVMRVKSE